MHPAFHIFGTAASLTPPGTSIIMEIAKCQIGPKRTGRGQGDTDESHLWKKADLDHQLHIICRCNEFFHFAVQALSPDYTNRIQFKALDHAPQMPQPHGGRSYPAISAPAYAFLWNDP